MRTHRSLHVAGALGLGLALLAGTGLASAAHRASGPTWITSKGKTVKLTLIAAYNNALGGYNFNGYAKGQMTITVPAGDTVHVTFSNKSALPHSVQIVKAANNADAVSVKDAFTGANSPHPTQGITKGHTQTFSFVAQKAGQYLLICAVPGHAAIGMWDNFVVSSSAKTASIRIQKNK